MATLRFHWDFFGPDASTTAAHFLKHVDEFCAKERIADYRHHITEAGIRSTATLECDESHLILVRDRLKPKRAERLG